MIVVNGRDAMASGYVWIAVEHNAVVRATLGLTQSIRPFPVLAEQFFAARLETTYVHDARLDVWAPCMMTEGYEIWRGGRAHAPFANQSGNFVRSDATAETDGLSRVLHWA